MRLLLLLSLFALASCTKPLTTEEKQKQWITENLGGNGPITIEQVSPPIGPWQLYKHGSYYYRVKAASGKTIWAEAYTSAWSVATAALDGSAVYRYRYWEETKVPILGLHYRQLTQ